MDDLDSFFSSLDATILKATSKTRLEDEKKRLAQKLRGSDRQGRIHVAGQIKEVNAQLEAIQWRNEASVALFQEQHCISCGSDHRTFLQFMYRQVTTSGAKVTRWARASKSETTLSHEVLLQRTNTTICSDCVEDFGFNLSTAVVKFGKGVDPLAVSLDYEQQEEELSE